MASVALITLTRTDGQEFTGVFVAIVTQLTLEDSRVNAASPESVKFPTRSNGTLSFYE